MAKLAQELPQIFRKAIDEVIDAPRTNRFILSETEKTEKTYLGTKIEILLRAHLGLPKGRILDLSIGGVETDIKNTMGGNWTIPQEAFGHPCLLLKENEKNATCCVGIIIARDAYLNPGTNRDAKRSFSIAGLQNVWWILKDHPYPPNFFELMPLKQRQAIMGAGGGTMRLAALFEAVQKKPISRVIVQALAQQHDYMKRVRRNGGARDVLAPKGIAILWGGADKSLITRLKLGLVGPDEFISYKPTDPAEIALLQAHQHID
jgi:Restriction endonuclease NaeI